MIASIVVVSALTRCALFHYMCYLKAPQMRVRRTINQKIILWEFKLCNNSRETTKKICCVKSEDAFDQNTVTRWLRKFRSGCNNFDDLVK